MTIQRMRTRRLLAEFAGVSVTRLPCLGIVLDSCTVGQLAEGTICYQISNLARVVGFGFEAAFHQFAEGDFWRTAIVQNGEHLFSDGHFDACFVSEGACGGGSSYSFRDHAHGGEDVIELSAAREFDADETVAAQIAGASQNQIAHSGETGESVAVGAQGGPEARYFGEAARDESSDGVMAQSETLGDSGGDGDNVFQRAAEFRADYVFIGVQAQRWAGKLALDFLCGLAIGGGDYYGRWVAAGVLFGEGGTREGSDARAEFSGQRLGHHFGDAQERVWFKALRGADEAHFRVQKRKHRGIHGPGVSSGHGADDDLRIAYRVLQFGSDNYVRRDAESGKERDVFARGLERFEDIVLAHPKRDVA